MILTVVKTSPSRRQAWVALSMEVRTMREVGGVVVVVLVVREEERVVVEEVSTR